MFTLAPLPGGYLLENLGYTFGFIIVILARQQLFTEKYRHRRAADYA